VNTPTDPLEWLLRTSSINSEIDRKALAGLLLEIARNVEPGLCQDVGGVRPVDLRLEQLRSLLVGREIDELSRLGELVEDRELFANAVGRILPTAFAQATTDAQLGKVLAPALEKATQASIKSDPRALIDILHPLMVPAIRKSIGESIDQTFQSLNESLKYSLTWRGLKWRWEAWRTGTPFAAVVLKHTLLYQVEHVFLIHRHTGLLIAHASAADAVSQDPQLVSSMLAAIQDFVRDSFQGADQRGLDSLRLGELRLWSEAGPFATLVAVIRGNPPEELHETLRNVLSRIHAERPRALENFDGDSSGLADIEAHLTECAALKQQARQKRRSGFPWLVALIGLAALSLAGLWGYRWWLDEHRWRDYVTMLQAQPGIVITELGREDGKFRVAGLRDPLAVDPMQLLREAQIDPARVTARWQSYQSLYPQFVLKRLEASLDPPATVTMAVQGDHIVAQGSAPAAWIERARAAAVMLPAGGPSFDLSAVRDIDEGQQLWENYVTSLRAQPGIVITELGRDDGKFRIAGLRDPLAIDPMQLLREAQIDPARVTARWQSYQSLHPQFVMKRLEASLDPPATVTMAVQGDHIVAQGSAPSPWIERARNAGRLLPAGGPSFDVSQVRDISEEAIGKLREAIQSRAIRFNFNESLPAPDQDPILDELASELKELATLSANLRVTPRVVLTGHSDTTGKGTGNISLSVARAESVRALLKKRGVDPDLLAVRGAGPFEPREAETSETARSANRRVSFTVGIE
jgi:outer membrane protein OmpA-like peptidoglycan-associated protein